MTAAPRVRAVKPGRPTPRSPQPRPSTGWTAFAILTLCLLLSLATWLGLTADRHTEADSRPEHVITTESMASTYTHDGEIIRWYVLVDPDTNVQYLVNDRGGCCVRLDRYGQAMGVDYGDE